MEWNGINDGKVCVFIWRLANPSVDYLTESQTVMFMFSPAFVLISDGFCKWATAIQWSQISSAGGTQKLFKSTAIISWLWIAVLLAFNWTKGSLNLHSSYIHTLVLGCPCQAFGLKCRWMTSTEFGNMIYECAKKELNQIYTHSYLHTNNVAWFFPTWFGCWINYNEVMRVIPKTDLNFAFNMFSIPFL